MTDHRTPATIRPEPATGLLKKIPTIRPALPILEAARRAEATPRRAA
jgi:hypothetical protein